MQLPDGSPSELTKRRYIRDAVGGSALIWFEAISIVPEGCSGSHQLMLTKENLEAYKKFTAEVKEAGYRANGYIPYLVMQANHSGRYSNWRINRLRLSHIVIQSMKNSEKQMILVS